MRDRIAAPILAYLTRARLSSIASDGALLGGAALMALGAGMIYLPAGLIVGGALLVGGAILADRPTPPIDRTQ